MPNSPSEPRWFEAETAILLNQIQVGETGEPHHLRDAGLLESAVAAPYNLFSYEGQSDILTLGIRLMVKIAQNHPFEQGNKRTAFHSGIVFIEANDLFVELPDMVATAERFLALVTGSEDERSFRRFVRPYVTSPADAAKFWRR